MINEDFITIELEVIDQDDESIEAVDKEIQEAYGMSYKEYVHFRNDLLRKYNYNLPTQVLSDELIKKAIIDLVANGYLSPDLTDVNAELSFGLTDKAFKAVVRGLENGWVEPEMRTWEALYVLRNNKQLN